MPGTWFFTYESQPCACGQPARYVKVDDDAATANFACGTCIGKCGCEPEIKTMAWLGGPNYRNVTGLEPL